MISKIEVGRIVEITNSDIIVEVLKKYESSHLIMNGKAMRITGVGSYIKVGTLVYQIDLEKIVDINPKIENGKIIVDKKLHCSLVGFIDNGSFKEGSNGEVPDLFQKVYKITEKEERLIYDNGDEINSINLGNYLLNKDILFQLDINKLIASHVLIVGNTGSGKSNTLATIYEGLFKEKETEIISSNSKFLIIDSNGEYNEAFSDNPNLINRKILNVRGRNTNSLKLPIRSLDEFDWKLLLEATDKTQFPVIRSVVTNVKKYIFESKTAYKERISNLVNWKVRDTAISILDSKESPSTKMAGLLKINDFLKNYSLNVNYVSDLSLDSILSKIEINNNRIKYSTSSTFDDDLKEIRSEFSNYMVIDSIVSKYSVYEFELLLNLEYLYRVYKYSISENNISPLLSRFSSQKEIYSKVFEAFDIERRVNYKDLEYLLFGKKPVALCDFSMAGKDIARSIVSLLVSKLFDSAIQLRSKNTKFSYHLVIDEAHNYLSRNSDSREDAISESCIEMFEKVIKEGRKFNTFITMATQRPSDITPTLLSQSHNYVIHKLVNPNDLSIIKNTVPFLDSMSAKMIPILAPGQAIFSGTAFTKPNIVQVTMPKFEVKSSTIDLVGMWSK